MSRAPVTKAERDAFFEQLRQRAADEASSLPAPFVQATRYEVSYVPEDNINRDLFTVYAEDRGNGRWAVVRHRQCLSTSGTWDWESRPSEREDDWLDEHRFDLDTALQLAQHQAALITCNGDTVTDVLRRHNQKEGEQS